MKIPFISLTKQYRTFEKVLINKIVNVMEKGEFCYGTETKKFEISFAKLCKSRYCAGVGSGTESLYIALKVLDIGWGDEVITTPFTFIATAEAIVNVGAKPVFVDIDEASMNIDVNKIEKVINKKTKAIIPVHIFGISVDMDPLLKIAKKHNLKVIEDASHAEGTIYKGKPVGSLGDIGCFSLYPSKTLGAYGNAGAIVTNDKLLFNKIKMISNHGRGKSSYIHELIGLTATIDNLQAAVLNTKLIFLPKWIKDKNKIAEKYSSAFSKLPIKVQKISEWCRPSFYVYSVLVNNRKKLMTCLHKKGIETKIYYPVPLHLQPSLKYLKYKKGDFPITEKMANSIVSLPLYPEMNKKEINYVIRKVTSFFN